MRRVTRRSRRPKPWSVCAKADRSEQALSWCDPKPGESRPKPRESRPKASTPADSSAYTVDVDNSALSRPRRPRGKPHRSSARPSLSDVATHLRRPHGHLHRAGCRWYRPRHERRHATSSLLRAACQWSDAGRRPSLPVMHGLHAACHRSMVGHHVQRAEPRPSRAGPNASVTRCEPYLTARSANRAKNCERYAGRFPHRAGHRVDRARRRVHHVGRGPLLAAPSRVSAHREPHLPPAFSTWRARHAKFPPSPMISQPFWPFDRLGAR